LTPILFHGGQLIDSLLGLIPQTYSDVV